LATKENIGVGLAAVDDDEEDEMQVVGRGEVDDGNLMVR